jgi:AAA domain
MLGTRQTARLLEATNLAGAKLVLVGDYRQLPELAAGGTFRALASELSPLRLTENHRQVNAWDRDALDDLQHGDVARALDTYELQGRITISTDVSAQRESLVSAWWDSFSQATTQGTDTCRRRRSCSPPVLRWVVVRCQHAAKECSRHGQAPVGVDRAERCGIAYTWRLTTCESAQVVDSNVTEVYFARQREYSGCKTRFIELPKTPRTVILRSTTREGDHVDADHSVASHLCSSVYRGTASSSPSITVSPGRGLPNEPGAASLRRGCRASRGPECRLHPGSNTAEAGRPAQVARSRFSCLISCIGGSR